MTTTTAAMKSTSASIDDDLPQSAAPTTLAYIARRPRRNENRRERSPLLDAQSALAAAIKAQGARRAERGEHADRRMLPSSSPQLTALWEYPRVADRIGHVVRRDCTHVRYCERRRAVAAVRVA